MVDFRAMATASRPLVRLVEALSEGQHPSSADLTLFSDLEQAEIAYLRDAWPRLSDEIRLAAMRRVVELAEDNVDLDYTRLAVIALDDASAAIRGMAIEAAWESTDRAIGLPLARILREDADEEVRAAAATGLARFVLGREFGTVDARLGETAVAALRESATDDAESVNVRARALESLGAHQEPWVATLLSDAYYSEDNRLRLAAIRGMGASADDRWLEFLDEQATSDDPEVRFATAIAYGVIGSEDGLDAVVALLADDDPEVVAAAINALGDIGGDLAIERLKTLAASDNPLLADAATDAIENASIFQQPDLLRRELQDDD